MLSASDTSKPSSAKQVKGKKNVLREAKERPRRSIGRKGQRKWPNKMTLFVGFYRSMLMTAAKHSTKLYWTPVPSPTSIQAASEMRSADIRPRLWSSVSPTTSHTLINSDSCLESGRVDVCLC